MINPLIDDGKEFGLYIQKNIPAIEPITIPTNNKPTANPITVPKEKNNKKYFNFNVFKNWKIK